MRAARRRSLPRVWAVDTAVATLNFDRIGHLPCNCSIGGPAKGHLAREVDALGGEMGRNTDKTLTHIRYVGTGKGPAVQTLRAHADKDLYPQAMRAVLEATPNLTLLQVGVEDLITEERTASGHNFSDDERNRGGGFLLVSGVRLADGTEIRASVSRGHDGNVFERPDALRRQNRLPADGMAKREAWGCQRHYRGWGFASGVSRPGPRRASIAKLWISRRRWRSHPRTARRFRS